jgi:hypothetical protein
MNIIGILFIAIGLFLAACLSIPNFAYYSGLAMMWVFIIMILTLGIFALSR